MRRRLTSPSRLYAAASLILAAMAGVLIHTYLTRITSASGAVGSPVSVVIVAQDVARGSTIEVAQLRIVRMPKAFAPPGSFSQVSQAVGRVALASLATGEAVTETRLTRVRAGPVASLTPEGLRAFAVPTSLPPGSVAPGDHVDVLATYGSGQPHTETAIAGAEVLLVLGPAQAGAGGGVGGGAGLDATAAGAISSVTLVLLVSPDEEERLAFATAFATLTVAIAPPGLASPGSTTEPLPSASPTNPPPAATPP